MDNNKVTIFFHKLVSYTIQSSNTIKIHETIRVDHDHFRRELYTYLDIVETYMYIELHMSDKTVR